MRARVSGVHSDAHLELLVCVQLLEQSGRVLVLVFECAHREGDGVLVDRESADEWPGIPLLQKVRRQIDVHLGRARSSTTHERSMGRVHEDAQRHAPEPHRRR